VLGELFPGLLDELVAAGNVTILDGSDVTEFLFAAREAVNGVRIHNRDNGIVTDLNTDLVVDAMGRPTRSPASLEARRPRKPANRFR
jgi:hypothetical protein